jgi:selenocysteine lyase/cysteine desulfurase
VAEIGRFSRERGILFSLDAIQTLGAFPVDAAEVDFLSADAHKWLLGPMAIGIVHVAKRNFPILKPTLIGAWNVHSPDFLTQPEIVFADTARRYEPGVLNIAGVYGMVAAIRMLIDHGIDAVAATILARRDHLENQLARLGFEFLSPKNPEPLRSGVVTARHGHIPAPDLFRTLEENHVVASLRKSRDGTEWLRFSPHFYNTDDEMDKVANILAAKLKA